MPERPELVKQALAVCKRATKDSEYSEAISLVTVCIQNKPDSAILYSHRAKSYLGLNQFQRALFDYSMAIRLEPSCGRNYAARGACFKKLGRIVEALRDFSDAIKYEKENQALYFFERGLVHYEQESYETAISDFTCAFDRKFPETVRLLLLRGICFRNLSKIPESISDLRQAVSLDSSSSEVHDNLGLSLAESPMDLSLAVVAFTSAIELDGGREWMFYYHRGLTQYKVTEYAKAVEDFSKALSMDGSEGKVWFSRGNSHLKQSQLDLAYSDFEEAIMTLK